MYNKIKIIYQELCLGSSDDVSWFGDVLMSVLLTQSVQI